MSSIIRMRVTVPTVDPSSKTDGRIAKLSAILGPKGIKAMDFLNRFEVETSQKQYPPTTPLIVHIIAVLTDAGKAESYTIQIATPSVSLLVKRAINVQKFCHKPGHDQKIKISKEKVDEIVDIKHDPLRNISKDSWRKSIEGSLRSMGVAIEK